MRRLNPKGLDVQLDDTRLFVGGKELTPSIRRLGDLKGVLLTHGLVNEENKDVPLYYMYRDIGLDHYKAYAEMDINYDITLIPEYGLGKEFNKTLGHYHPIAENGLGYPEVYEVIEGNALYLFQRKNGSGYDVEVIYAKAGDKVLVPPNYGHITANIGQGMLVMANLKNGSFTADYKSIEDMHGGAVYALQDGELLLNKRYKEMSLTVGKTPQDSAILPSGGSIHDDFVKHPERFEFLNRPSLLQKV